MIDPHVGRRPEASRCASQERETRRVRSDRVVDDDKVVVLDDGFLVAFDGAAEPVEELPVRKRPEVQGRQRTYHDHPDEDGDERSGITRCRAHQPAIPTVRALAATAEPRPTTHAPRSALAGSAMSRRAESCGLRASPEARERRDSNPRFIPVIRLHQCPEGLSIKVPLPEAMCCAGFVMSATL